LLLLLVQALSQRTLVMLMGDDPAKNQSEVISAAEPHVTFAYLKHLWHSDKKVWLHFASSQRKLCQVMLAFIFTVESP